MHSTLFRAMNFITLSVCSIKRAREREREREREERRERREGKCDKNAYDSRRKEIMVLVILLFEFCLCE